MGKFLDNTGLTKLVELIKGSLPGKATSSTLGLVKPDNSTITIDSDGIISSSGGGGSSYTFTNGLTESSGTVSWDLNDRIRAGTGVKSCSIGGLAADKVQGQSAVVLCDSVGSTYNFGKASCAIGSGHSCYGSDELSAGSSNELYGSNTIALGQGLLGQAGQFIIGKYNVQDNKNKFKFIIGGGSAYNTRANLTTIDNNGNEYLSGNLYVGCSDYTTTSNGPTTANCGGQQVFYGSLVSTETSPTVNDAINWVYG